MNCGTANGTAIDQWASLGNTCQQWKFTSAGNGHYTITNVNSGTTLDSVNCGQSNGTALDLWPRWATSARSGT
ncbi:RICIN domain-containing protein [Streptomyces sp. L7]